MAQAPSSSQRSGSTAPAASGSDDLVAPEAAAGVASALDGLVRTLSAEPRAPSVNNAGGPTLEDLARDTLRPLIKQWLDAHLPALVERLVRIEIERVVGRAVG